MSPRPYRMTRRAAAVDQTRQRILNAALAEYAESGIAGTSMQAVARRADVASGTVLYHYPTPDDLADAVLVNTVHTLAAPTADDIDPEAPLADRMRTVTSGFFRVYRNTDLEYRAWLKSRAHPAMKHWEQWYLKTYGQALSKALGNRAADAGALQIASALIDPGFRASLLQRGFTEEQAIEQTVRLLMAWLASADPTPAHPA
ncbi:MAG: TetR/AcrR family transcriptional regulator [Candidatus Nanopelagicales bacterium]